MNKALAQNFVIIVAGGSGKRVGGELPKQFQLAGGIPVLLHSLNTFRQSDPQAKIILVLPEEHFKTWDDIKCSYGINAEISIVAGGKERFYSVKNALDSIEAEEGMVAIHDAARPFITRDLVSACFKEAAKTGSAVPVAEVPYSLRKVKKDGTSKAVNRARLRIVQTPQVFKIEELKQAYQKKFSEEFTDDASVYEAAGFRVNILEGENRNIKITTAEDMEYADYIFQRGSK